MLSSVSGPDCVCVCCFKLCLPSVISIGGNDCPVCRFLVEPVRVRSLRRMFVFFFVLFLFSLLHV